MTRPPFGFGPSDHPDEPDDAGDDPLGLAKVFGGLLGGAPGAGGDLMGQLASLMSWSGGPVNWDLATSIAGSAHAAGADTEVDPTDAATVADACRLADLWLDPLTTLPGSGGTGQAWSRAAWLTATRPAWRRLVDPVAGRVVAAMGTAMERGLSGGFGGALGEGLPEEMKGLLDGIGPLKGVMDQVGGFVFGAQVGQALGALAGEVLSSTEIGLPLGEPGRPALLPANVAVFGAGLEVPVDEVRLYVALRECAHQRLFAHVPWLKAHLFDAVDAYARGIEVDPEAIERAIGSLDPTDPESLQRALGDGVFELPPTAAQQAALARLETALALVEGWVDAVVDEAARGPLASAAALRETIRRRRASGGPAEQTFTTLVGLKLRPRRLREAADLWSAVAATRGVEGRDALWAHPDLLPGPEELDDVAAFLARTAAGSSSGGDSGTDWDAELRGLDGDGDR